MNKDELKGKAKDLKGLDAFGRGKRRMGEAIEDAGERIKE